MNARGSVEVDLAAFRSNVERLAATAAPARCMTAVKADAYGHGLIPLAHAALEAGADSLAVLETTVAIRLRREGIGVPLFAWLHGSRTDFKSAIEADVDLGISSLAELRAVLDARAGNAAAVHLKVDTGLHRNGARPEDWPALVREALEAERAGRIRIAALWSHLADASPADDAEALERFREAVTAAADLGCRPPLLHLAASSAGLRMPEARLGLVRFGIAAYGISPFDDASGHDLGLRPVMSLHSHISGTLSADDAQDLRFAPGTSGEVAIVPIGSADGVPAPALGKAEVLLRGRRAPLVGIGIDSCAVAPVGGVNPGDAVVFFGPGDDGEPTAEEWADWAGTIGDEIVVRAGARLPRRYAP